MQKRLLSLDILRGMTIFFMIVVNTPGSWKYVYSPLKHAPWDGWTPTDLVFPFFVFIVGLSMSFSFRKYESSEKSAWIKKVLIRTVLIFLVGLLLNYFPFFNKELSNLRIFGVLPRIALAYGGASFLIIFLKDKWLPWALVIILLGYWAILLFFGGEDPLSLKDNAVRALDLFLIGENHIYKGYGIPFDPEGLLSAIPTVGSVLFGFLIGKNIVQVSTHHIDKIKKLVIFGATAIAGAYLWQWIGFPINKPIWSSSYVLLTAGLGSLLLALLIWIIDILGYQKWATVFKAFGLNPLISYVLSGLFIKLNFLTKIGDTNVYGWLYRDVFQPTFGNYLGSFLQALTYTLFIWFFAWLLYINKKVIKL